MAFGSSLPVREKNLIPVTEFLKLRVASSTSFKPGNEHILEEIQNDVDNYWKYLEGRVEGSKDLTSPIE